MTVEQIQRIREVAASCKDQQATAELLTLANEAEASCSEIWRPIHGIDGIEVSNTGRVRSVRPQCLSGKCYKKRGGGYYAVRIRRRLTLVHRLVAAAFVPNPKNLPCVDHVNGDKHDNRPENLEWVDYRENTVRAIRTGLLVNLKGDEVATAKLDGGAVRRIRAALSSGKTQREVARDFGISKAQVTRINLRQSWRHVA